jgi:uncharacterized membrane protein YeiH
MTEIDVILILDLLGVFFFAMSGCLLAARKGFDIVGSLLLGSLVGLGGGVVRDLIIGIVPAAFSNPLYLVPPVLATLLVYFLFSHVERFGGLLVVFDAGGLAVFCAIGTQKALEFDLNPVSSILLGVTTAVGGGLLRDVTANEVPRIFDPQDVYAVPAFAGAALMVLLDSVGWSNVITISAVAVAVFGFRVLAWRYHWQVPLAVQGWRR